MYRFKITIIYCFIMALCLPYADILAVSSTSPTYTHFVYMAGHAGWLHYIVNVWSLLVLHNLYKWYRVLTAYIVAVFISYTLLPAQPMVGASVFTCFFIGFWAVYLWHRDKLAVILSIALLVLTCILPGFAGVPHVAAYIYGVLFCETERRVWRIINYLKF